MPGSEVFRFMVSDFRHQASGFSKDISVRNIRNRLERVVFKVENATGLMQYFIPGKGRRPCIG